MSGTRETGASGTGTLKQRLASGEPVLGTFLQMGEPSVVEILAGSGLDFAIADLEHGTLDFREAIGLVRAAELHGMSMLARVPLRRLVQAGPLLDSGFGGILVPQVSTADQARLAVSAARYPPTGDRGACLGTRSDQFGTTSWSDHLRTADVTTLVVVAIESIEGVAAAEEICAVDGVDAVFLGVFDLSTSLGVPGQMDHPHVIRAVEAVTRVAHGCGMPIGAWSPSMVAARRLLASGMTFLPVSSDLLLWGEACRLLSSAWRAALESVPASPVPASTLA